LSRPAVLFFDVGDAGFVPLVDRVARAGLLPVVQHASLAHALAAAGVEHRAWDDFVPAERDAALASEYLRFLDGLADAFARPEVVGAFDSRLGNPLPAVKEPFFSLLLVLLLRQVAAIDQLDRLAEQLDLRLLVLGSDNSHVQRALVGRARALGIPSLQLAHGIYPMPFARKAGEMDRLYADHVAVFGKRARDILLELGNDPDRVQLTGSPLWDALYEEAARMPRDRACRELGLDPARPVVLLCATYTDGSCVEFRRKALRHVGLHHAMARAIAAHPERPQLVVRPHPNEIKRADLSQDDVAELVRAYAHWCALRDQPVAALSLDDRIAAIRAADAVVVESSSTVIAEALILERPVVLLRAFDPPVYGEADGVVVCELDELPAALARALGDASDGKLARRRARALPELNHQNDGRATERVAALIERLAQTGAQPSAPPAAPAAPRDALRTAVSELLRGV
jgi:hypothetical protein